MNTSAWREMDVDDHNGSTSMPKASTTLLTGTAGIELKENIVDRKYTTNDIGVVVVLLI